MKEKPAASGFLNDENDKVDDENDNEAEKARQDYMHCQHEEQSNEYSKICTRDRSSSLKRSRWSMGQAPTASQKPQQPLMKDAKNVQQYAEYQGKEGKWETKSTYSAGGNQNWS